MRLSAPLFRLKRQARLLARREHLPLHAALDRIASGEGFSSWGYLAAHQRNLQAGSRTPEASVLTGLNNGELLLLAARPGHGKTLFGIHLLVEAIRTGHQAVFYSAECSMKEVQQRLADVADKDAGVCSRVKIDLSDHLCADHIENELSTAGPGTIAVVDYLQLLDQRRTEPELSVQIAQLKAFALKKGLRLVFLSQVHRSFDPARKQLPDFADLRLPNPVDLSHFSKGCFLHDGEMAIWSN